MKTLIIGLGNPILCDDGVGWRVIQTIDEQLGDDIPPGVELDRISLGGISLMERLVGYDRAVLVDAVQTNNNPPGTVYRMTLDDLPTFNANAIHDVSLKTALELGRGMGAKLPDEITVFAIESVNLWDFGEMLTPQVEASVLPAAQAVLAEIENWRKP